MTIQVIIPIIVGIAGTTALFLMVFGLWRLLVLLFTFESKKRLKESRAYWMERCEELELKGQELDRHITIQHHTILSEQQKVNNWAEKSGMKDAEIRQLKQYLEAIDEINLHYLQGWEEAMNELKRCQLGLNPKYNKNVTRGEDGRYKSLKTLEKSKIENYEWKDARNT